VRPAARASAASICSEVVRSGREGQSAIVRLVIDLLWRPDRILGQHRYTEAHMMLALAGALPAERLQRFGDSMAALDFAEGSLIRLVAELNPRSPDGGFHARGRETIDLADGHFEVSRDAGRSWSRSVYSLQAWLDYGQRAERPHLTLDASRFERFEARPPDAAVFEVGEHAQYLSRRASLGARPPPHPCAPGASASGSPSRSCAGKAAAASSSGPSRPRATWWTVGAAAS